MGILDELLQQGNDKQTDYAQFAKRYDQGEPEDGYDDDEVGRRYDEVSRHVDRATYQKAAKQSLAKMKPAQRKKYAQELKQHAKQHGHKLDYDGKSTDPETLAGLTTQLHDKDPGLLGQIMGAVGGGGGAGGMVGSLLGGAGGGGGAGGMVGNLVGGAMGGSASKGVMAGIVSYATKSLLNK